MGNRFEGGRLTVGLHRHRYRIVLWIAVVEALLVWATYGLHVSTIVVLGVIAVASLIVYGLARDRTKSPFLHEITWLLAASQLGATIAVAAGKVVATALVVVVVIFALIALGLLVLERR